MRIKKIFFLPKEGTRYLSWKETNLFFFFIFFIVVIRVFFYSFTKNYSYNLPLFVDRILKGPCIYFYGFSRIVIQIFFS